MANIFLDTDVAFDIISKRLPYFDESVKLLELMIEGKIVLHTSESCVANLIYLASDIYKIKGANEKLVDFLLACELISCGKQRIIEALKSPLTDKEDAVQYYTALHHGLDYFVTRNVKDYVIRHDSLPVLMPIDFNKIIDTA
ncbi:MAG: PIN domain-containing protein [Bacteroidota bacterium]